MTTKNDVFMQSAPVHEISATGRVLRDANRFERVMLAPGDWQALALGPGDRVQLETADGDVIAAEVLQTDAGLEIHVRTSIGAGARTVRVRRPRRAA